MKNTKLPALIAAIVVTAGSVEAQTGWIRDTLSEQCAPASKSMVVDATRRTIERSVARAEASIRAPASTTDLSCMNDLMAVDLDIFSADWKQLEGFDIGDLINDVVSGLESGLSVQTLTTGVERAVCDFARQKFEERTDAPTGSMEQIVSRLAPDLPKFEDRFGLINIPRGVSNPIHATGPASGWPGPARTHAVPAPEAAATGDPSEADGGRSRAADGDGNPVRSIWNALRGFNQ